MEFDTEDIKKRAREDFEKAWVDTAKILPSGAKDYSGGKGNVHPVQEISQEIRKIFLELGFDEVENPLFVPEEEVYWQYGPEAPVILDRCYYLAGLPRPDIGLGDKTVAEIKKIAKVDIEKFKGILRDYREGSVEGDDLFEEIVNVLGIKAEQAARIIGLFPEFRSLSPVAEKTTLRSHMTAAWFPTLRELQGKAELPVKLFSVGLRFRREQKVDAHHLRAHYGASCVIMDPDVSLEAGKKVSEGILRDMGFKDIKFVKKKATSNYYAPGTEFEIFSGNVEIADCGMYSPIALSNYGIKYPVFNIGFGLERILLIRTGIDDIRKIMYPQFYQALELSDEEIVKEVGINKAPGTDDGKRLAESIKKAAKKHADEDSPCEFPVYDGEFLGKNIRVKLVEKEDNTKLLGPAALNEIYVSDGGIYGVPKNPEKLSAGLVEVKKKGVKTGLSCLDAISSYFAAGIEELVGGGKKSGFLQIKMAKTPADVNIGIGNRARRFISSRQRGISIKGPVFMAVEFTIT